MRVQGYRLFWGDKFTPTCLVLRRLPYFFENFLFVNYRRFNQSCKDFSPENEKKKIQQQQQQKQKKEKKEEKLNLWIYNVLKNMFIMLLS